METACGREGVVVNIEGLPSTSARTVGTEEEVVGVNIFPICCLTCGYAGAEGGVRVDEREDLLLPR